jgi:chromosome condensin MukBEF MukE localization factor
VTTPTETPKIEIVLAFHLIRLGGTLFADMRLTDIVAEGHSLNIDLGGQLHKIYRVSLRGNKFTTAEVVFGFGDTQKAAAENGVQLRLETLEDGSLVSLASTKELQDFVKKTAKDERVFSQEVEWDRPEKETK